MVCLVSPAIFPYPKVLVFAQGRPYRGKTMDSLHASPSYDKYLATKGSIQSTIWKRNSIRSSSGCVPALHPLGQRRYIISTVTQYFRKLFLSFVAYFYTFSLEISLKQQHLYRRCVPTQIALI